VSNEVKPKSNKEVNDPLSAVLRVVIGVVLL